MNFANNKKRFFSILSALIFMFSVIMSSTSYAANATSMKLESETNTISVGGNVIIDARVQFDDSTNRNVRLSATWTSSNPEVATVMSGTVEGFKEGTTLITAEYKGVKATTTITVAAASIKGLSLSESDITIDLVGSSRQIYSTASSSSGDGSDVSEYATWNSSDTKVATVDAGTITSVGPGTAKITATYKGFSADATVTVKDSKATKITVSDKTIKTGKNVTNGVLVNAVLSNSSIIDVTKIAEYKSSDEKIFLVEEGLITGVSNGNAKLEVSYGGFTEVVNVVVGTTIVLQINNPKMNVRGVEKEIDPGRGTKPIVRNNRTLLPIRALIEELGGTVEWNSEDKKVTIELNMKKIELWINKKNALVDAVPTTLDVSPLVVNGRTVIPLRFVSETLGYKVDWNGSTKKATITD